MKNKANGILVSDNKDLYRDLVSRLAGMVDMTDREPQVHSAYELVKKNQPQLLFLDMAGPGPDLINLGKRVKKNQPDTCVFCIDTRKDPDMILAGFRMGFNDFFHYPFNGTDVQDLVRRALNPSAGGPGGEVISVFSLKGGAGVTTLAVNLADQMAALTRDRVLLLDLNLFFGDICAYLNLKTAYSPYDLIRNVDRMDKNLLFSSLYCHKNRFHILTTGDEISDSDSVAPEDVMDMIALLRRHFDHIIIDCPHDLSGRTLQVCLTSDKILALVQQNIPSAKSVQSVIDFFEDLDFPADRVKIIINRYLKGADMGARDLEQIFARPVYCQVDNNYPLFIQAAARGMTLDESAPGNRINAQVRTLAGKLSGIRPARPTGWKRFIPGGFVK